MKRFKKGSPEAREYMAKLRAMRKGGPSGRKLKARGQARLRKARDIKRAMKADTWEGNVLPKARKNPSPVPDGMTRDSQLGMNYKGRLQYLEKLLDAGDFRKAGKELREFSRFVKDTPELKKNPRCRNRGDTMFRCTAYFPKPSKPITHMLCAPNERVVKDEFWGILVRNGYDPDRSKFVIKAQPHLNPRKRKKKIAVRRTTAVQRTRTIIRAAKQEKHLPREYRMTGRQARHIGRLSKAFAGTRRRYIDATKNPVQKVRTRKLRDPDASLAKKSWVIFVRRDRKTFFYTGSRLNTELAEAFPFRNKESALFHAQKLAKRFPQHEWGIKG